MFWVFDCDLNFLDLEYVFFIVVHQCWCDLVVTNIIIE